MAVDHDQPPPLRPQGNKSAWLAFYFGAVGSFPLFCMLLCYLYYLVPKSLRSGELRMIKLVLAMIAEFGTALGIPLFFVIPAVVLGVRALMPARNTPGRSGKTPLIAGLVVGMLVSLAGIAVLVVVILAWLKGLI